MPPIELELKQIINADSGVPLVVNGAATSAYIVPMLEGFSRAEGELINRSGPYAIAAAADVAAIGAERGDTLTFDGVDYTIVVIDPDTAGTVILGLEVEL